MSPDRLAALLARFAELKVAVLGDFFVDQYLLIDPALAEVSLETGLEAHQVVGVRSQPGAAGTVTNNLSALGVGTILAVGFHGDDGWGYELRRGLAATRVSCDGLVTAAGCFTPTYTKPLVQAPAAAPRELNRLDIKNRQTTPPALEDQVLERLVRVVEQIDALLVLDQVDDANTGVVTARVREAVATLGRRRPELPVIADSRSHISLFRDVMLKPNVHEAAAALGELGEPVESAPLHELARRLAQRQGRPCFITLGGDGVLAAEQREVVHVPAVPVPGPIDIVGAGDSFCAASMSALAAGATLVEAAQVGCLVASITVQQIGTTGTATPAQVLARLADSPYTG